MNDDEELELERAEWLSRPHSVTELSREIRGLWSSVDSWIGLLRVAKTQRDEAYVALADARDLLYAESAHHQCDEAQAAANAVAAILISLKPTGVPR